MNYERLRTEYNAAFGSLRAAVWELRSISRELSSDNIAGEAAQQRVDQALGLYRECRNDLADFLTSHQPAEQPAVSVGSHRLGVWATGMDRRAAGSHEGAIGRRREVQVLAHRLWEKAGRPVGSPDIRW
jgi:hypothetical protein